MPHYRFALQNDGTRIEELGGLALPDDGEAIAFGERIVSDLADGRDQQAGLAVAIIKGARTVRSISLE